MSYTRELNLARTLTRGSLKYFVPLFREKKIKVVESKGAEGDATNLGLSVSDDIVAAAGREGYRVLTEERGGSAQHGDNKIFVLDPDDGTADSLEGQFREPPRSTCACALAYWDHEPVVGAVRLPLLGIDLVTYYASKGEGAFREYGKKRERIKVDLKPEKGIVMVSVKDNALTHTLMEKVRRAGHTPVQVDGAVFKACAVADPWLLYQYLPEVPELPVVGFCSVGLHLHDMAATTCIVREAGGVATSPLNREGKQAWAAANNSKVYRSLMGCL